MEQINQTTIHVKHTPIQFCWKSARKEEKHGGAGGGKENAGELKVDPHRTGFGRNPANPPVRTPLPCWDLCGILGIDPRKSTCGEIAHGESGDGVGERTPGPTNAKAHLGCQSPTTHPLVVTVTAIPQSREILGILRSFQIHTSERVRKILCASGEGFPDQEDGVPGTTPW